MDDKPGDRLNFKYYLNCLHLSFNKLKYNYLQARINVFDAHRLHKLGAPSVAYTGFFWGVSGCNNNSL